MLFDNSCQDMQNARLTNSYAISKHKHKIASEIAYFQTRSTYLAFEIVD